MGEFLDMIMSWPSSFYTITVQDGEPGTCPRSYCSVYQIVVVIFTTTFLTSCLIFLGLLWSNKTKRAQSRGQTQHNTWLSNYLTGLFKQQEPQQEPQEEPQHTQQMPTSEISSDEAGPAGTAAKEEKDDDNDSTTAIEDDTKTEPPSEQKPDILSLSEPKPSVQNRRQARLDHISRLANDDHKAPAQRFTFTKKGTGNYASKAKIQKSTTNNTTTTTNAAAKAPSTSNVRPTPAKGPSPPLKIRPSKNRKSKTSAP